MNFEVRNVWRSLMRTKGFAVVTILTLALGIGSASAIFSVVARVLFRPLSAPEDVVMVGTRNSGEFVPVIYDAQYRAFRERYNVFADLGVAAVGIGNVVVDGYPVATSVLGVSPNLLGLVGVYPALGRSFMPGEDNSARNNVVIVSDRFWKKFLSSSTEAIGRDVTVDGTICRVVGVLKPDENIPRFFSADVYRPLVYSPQPDAPWTPPLFAAARLQREVSREQATNILAYEASQLEHNHPFFVGQFPAIESLSNLQKTNRSHSYWILLSAVGFLYAIACLNGMNLLLVRIIGRRRELSIRLALGARPWDVIRIVLLESVLIAAAASVVGVLISNWIFPIFLRLCSEEIVDQWNAWSLRWDSLVFLCIATVTTALCIGSIPAFVISRDKIAEGFRGNDSSGGEIGQSFSRFRTGLIVLQVAFAIILLSGAGLMVRTFQRYQNIDLGFIENHALKVQVDKSANSAPGTPEPLILFRGLADFLRRLPGVETVGIGNDLLLPGWYFAGSTVQLPNGSNLQVALDYASPGYLKSAGVTLKYGRWPNDGSTTEVLINEALADARFGGANALGTALKASIGQEMKSLQIVGVVKNVREVLKSDPGYHVLCPESMNPPLLRTVIVRFSYEPDASAERAIREAIFHYSPNLIVLSVTPLSSIRHSLTTAEHFTLSVFQVLSMIAFALTVSGTFSMLSFIVSTKMKEFGVRLALGASTRDIFGIVVKRAIIYTSVGSLLGIVGSLQLGRFLNSLLFRTTPGDPMVLVAVIFLSMLAGLIASVIPAFRASRADIASLTKSD